LDEIASDECDRAIYTEHKNKSTALSGGDLCKMFEMASLTLLSVCGFAVGSAVSLALQLVATELAIFLTALSLFAHDLGPCVT
jgi:hypothetical protein